jgi:NADH-quinone oxidoreductase subunit J
LTKPVETRALSSDAFGRPDEAATGAKEYGATRRSLGPFSRKERAIGAGAYDKRRAMQANALFFWIFAPVLVASAFAVIMARNPVHSVLFLILSFVCAAGLFLLMGAEFLAMILVVVYVGAVAVLFLFVVMLLDVDFARLRQGFVEYLPQGLLIALVVGIELIYVVSGLAPSQRAAPPATPEGMLSNTAALGEVLYTRYIYFFQASGLILLTAMIGAIVLTLNHKPGVKRQNIGVQVARNPETAVEVRKVPSRAGI